MEKTKNAFRHRNAVCFTVLFAALCGVSLDASAAYAQLAPPAGWTAGTGTAGATFRGAANEAIWLANGTARTNAALNVAGRSVLVPATMRMAANAPLFAARAMFLNPWVAGALVLAPFAIEWARQSGYRFEGGMWVKDELTCLSGSQCGGYKLNGDTAVYATPTAACGVAIEAYNKQDSGYTYSLSGVDLARMVCKATSKRKDGQGDPGEFEIPFSTVEEPGTVKTRPATKPEFETDVPKLPMPWQVPNEVPFDVPVEQPVINPSPAGVPQPLYVPQGSPQPVPNTDPQQYTQPTVKVTPAPTAASPWQVDVLPQDVTSTDPAVPMPDQPASSPSTSTEKTSDLCLEHPEILACAKVPELDTPDGEIPKSEKTISFTPENPFGGGGCPADVYASFGSLGKTFKIWDWQKTCDYAAPLRALVIGLATFAAFLIVMPGESRV